MRAFVTLKMPDGDLVDLGPGDIIGRLWSAALKLDDARISEAHAMVSLRGERLQLLALRGRFAVDQRPCTSVTLRPGLEIELARGLAVTVDSVALPSRVLAVEGPGLPRQVLSGVTGLRLHPRPTLVAGYEAGLDALFWSDGDRWRARIGGGAARIITPGDDLDVGGLPLRVVSVDLSSAAQQATRLKGPFVEALRIVARYDTCHLYRRDTLLVSLSGLSARILSELAVIGAPVDWAALAAGFWPDGDDRDALRRRFDVNLARLRRKLRDAGVRPDLIRADGLGNYELLLYDGDTIVDES